MQMACKVARRSLCGIALRFYKVSFFEKAPEGRVLCGVASSVL